MNIRAGGAGIATFISSCFAFLYFTVLFIVLHGKTYVSLNPKNVSFSSSILKNIFTVGFPGVVQNNLNVASIIIFNNIAAGFGTCAVASIGIVNKVNQLPIQIIFGFSQGVMPLIGYNFACKNSARVKETIKRIFQITLGSLFVVLALYLLIPESIVRMFMENEEIVTTGAGFLRGFGLSLPFMCIDFVVVGVSQSFGFGKYAFAFSILRKAVFEIPFILIFSRIFGLYGLCFCVTCAEFLMSVIALAVLRKLLKKL